MSDARLHSPACERNRDPILRVLEQVLPPRGLVLEIASGTGMHAVWFAPRLPHLVWQPSDVDEAALASIEAWRRAEPAENLRAPIRLDVTRRPWPVDRADAIFNANMIHIAPWECCVGMFDGVGRHLLPGGVFALYGPFRVGGAHTAESNASFDAGLRARDPRWGVRDLEAVTAEAERVGLRLSERVAMPANNFTLVFARAR